MTDASADAARKPAASGPAASSKSGKPALGGADKRNAEKELSSLDRRLKKYQGEIAVAHEKLAVHDQGDYAGLGVITTELQKLESTVADLEVRWLEVSELLEG